MKKMNIKNLLTIVVLTLALAACGGKSDDGKTTDESTSSASVDCDKTNKIEAFSFDGTDLKFDVKGAGAVHIKGATYKVVLTNYEDWKKSSKDLAKGDIKLEIALFNPVNGDDFETGTYNYGNKVKKNKVALSIYNGDVDTKSRTFNIAGMENAGTVTIDAVNKTGICGTATLTGKANSELKVSFNVKTK